MLPATESGLDEPAADEPEPLELPAVEGDTAADDAPSDSDDDLGLDEQEGDLADDSEVGEAALGLEFDFPEDADDGDGDGDEPGPEESEGFEEEVRTLLGPGEEHTGLGDDEALGLDGIVETADDGGEEGLDDVGGERVDLSKLPPLDGEAGDERGEDLDVGVEIDVHLRDDTEGAPAGPAPRPTSGEPAPALPEPAVATEAPAPAPGTPARGVPH
ncbi:MAG: hypothetical protein IT373_00965 [Polyangiaceae bacterium]|nr:hypothetical protein [Polyangiaceae bacterium]